MTVDIITLEELEVFKRDLLLEIRTLLTQGQIVEPQRWLKSQQVKKLLGISAGTLQQFRINGTLPFTKVGGVIFYDAFDIEKMLKAGKQNTNDGEEENQSMKNRK